MYKYTHSVLVHHWVEGAFLSEEVVYVEIVRTVLKGRYSVILFQQRPGSDTVPQS